MKRNIYLFGVLTLLSAILANPARIWSQAEYSNYYIEGYYQMHSGNKGLYYTLTDITAKGVDIRLADGQNSMLNTEDTTTESVKFVFDTISTDCPWGFKSMQFYKMQNNGKWQRDLEVEQAKQEGRADMVRVVMLVIDCSNSLKSDFGSVKNSAIKAIKILQKKTIPGTVHVGIIAFNTVKNTDKQIYPITPLNKEAVNDMEQWIKGLHTENNTAMYYAMHKGYDVVVDYMSNLDLPNEIKFSGVTMLTFTDGIDNNSLLPDSVFRKGLNNPYHKYVGKNIVNCPITYTHKSGQTENTYFESRLFFVPGDDVIEDEQLQRDIFNSLDSERKAFMLKNFTELDKAFAKMADNIVDRFQTLKCYVPRAHEGKVRWTLDKPKGFFGISAGGFGEMTGSMDIAAGGGAGIDFAFHTKNFAAVGGFINIKGGGPISTGTYPTHIQLGLLRAGNGFQYKSKPLFGIGLDIRPSESNEYYVKTSKGNKKYFYSEDDTGIGLVLRAGIISKNHLYYYADLFGGYMQSQRKTTTYYPNGNLAGVTGKQWFNNVYFGLALNLGFKF